MVSVTPVEWSPLGGIEPGTIPRRRPGERPRLLLITLGTLGWSTLADRLDRFAATRPDLSTYHLRLSTPEPMRWANRGLPKLGLAHLMHPSVTWDLLLRSWLVRDRLPLNSFDAIYVAPITLMTALTRNRAKVPRLAASCDTTAGSWNWIKQGSPGGVFRPGSAPPNAAEKRLFESCDLITPWTDGLARAIEIDYAIPKHRILVTPPSVDRICADRQWGTLRLPRVVFVGNDFLRKGGPELVGWHQRHAKRACELHIVSSKAIPDRRLENVVWHGRVPNETLTQQLLPEMDLFVFPTKSDTVGIVLAEAQAAGLPVVTYKVGFLPDMLAEGRSGLSFELGDSGGFYAAIGRLIGSPDLLKSLSAGALDWARCQFMAERVLGRLFDRLAEETRCSSSPEGR